MTLTYSLGGHAYDYATWLQSNGGTYNYLGNVPAYYKIEDTWKKPGDNAKFRAISTTADTPMSSRFVADNNVFSGESISVGYESQGKWLKSVGASSLTVRAYMNDIFRISTVKNERGIDYPFARSVSMSLGLRF